MNFIYFLNAKIFAGMFCCRCGALVKDLKEQKGGGGNRDQQYLLMAIDILGRVAGGLAEVARCGWQSI